MRYLSQTAASYVGVDLHARTLFVCVLDQADAAGVRIRVGCSRRSLRRADTAA